MLCRTACPCVWHDLSISGPDSLMCVTWLISVCAMTQSRVCDKNYPCVYDMTHSYVRYDSIMRVTRLLHMRDITHSYVQHNSFVMWLIHSCDMTRPYVWHDSFMCVTLCTFICGFLWTHSYHVTHCNTLQHTATHCNTAQRTSRVHMWLSSNNLHCTSVHTPMDIHICQWVRCE